MKKLYNRLLRLLRKKTKYEDKPLVHVYTDKFGNKYYTLEFIEQINYKRSVVAEQAVRQAEFCLTADDLLSIFNKMEDYGNQGDIVNLFNLIIECKNRLNYAGEEETLLALASVYFFKEGENVDVYNIQEQNKKIETWKKDDEAKVFFLAQAFKRTRTYFNISEEHIMNCLMNQALPTHPPDKLSATLGRNSILISKQ